MTTDQIKTKMADGCEIIREQVRVDVVQFAVPVKREPQVWVKWLADQLRERGFEGLANEASPHTARKLAMMLAFEVLYGLGGYDAPLLCIPACLQGEAELTYWRAIAIAANS